MTGEWTFNKYLKVSYSWSNAPSGMKSIVPIDSNKYKPGDMVSVDETMTATTAYKDESAKKYYTFSGWNKSGSFNISSDINISGSWDNGKSIGDATQFITSHANDSTYTYNDICYGNGKFVGSPKNGKYAYSIDGINFEMKSFPVTQEYYHIRFVNNLFIVFHPYCASMYKSSNGINWTITSSSMSTSYYWMDICYMEATNKYLLVAYTGVGRSSNLSSWTYDNNGSYTQYMYCSYLNKILFVVYTTTNDNTWHVASGPNFNNLTSTYDAPTGAYLTGGYNPGFRVGKVYYYGSYYVATTYAKGLFYSTDGTSWNVATLDNSNSGTTRYYTMIVYTGNYYIAINDTHTYLSYSTNCIDWTVVNTNIDHSSISNIHYNTIFGVNGSIFLFTYLQFVFNSFYCNFDIPANFSIIN